MDKGSERHFGISERLRYHDLPMSLTLRQLEVFLAAADDCNFRRAAQRLGISQPSVSGRIRSLEIYLGYDLFHRAGGSGARLTDEGRAFVAKARHLVHGASQLSSGSATHAERSLLRLTVAIGPLLLKQRVMPALPTFCYEHPEIAVDFVPLGVAIDGVEMIRRGHADVLLYNGDVPNNPEFEFQVVRTAQCSIFGAPKLLDRISTEADAIANAPFILPPEHHAWTSWARSRLAEVGVVPTNIVMRPQFPELRLQIANEGRGLSVFFDEFVADTILKPVRPALRPANLVMVIGSRASHSTAAALVTFLKQVTKLKDTQDAHHVS
jgi:DNA-binding transcriptional LysR family regulator